MKKQKKRTIGQKLEWAIMHNSMKEVDDILAKKKSREGILRSRDDKGRSPIHWAAEQPGAVAIVSMLREFGFDCDDVDHRGWTPLHCSTAVGELQTSEYLICSNADVAAQNTSGTTPLHLIVRFTPSAACRQAYDDLLLSMVTAAPSLAMVNHLGETPLHQAALRGNLPAMRALLEGGAAANALTNMDESPLHYATRSGNLEAVSLLLGKGADASIMGKNGTALDVAYSSNLQDCIELLSISTGKDLCRSDQHSQKLIQILRHPELCLVFFDFLAKRYSDENLSFWVAVEDFRVLNDEEEIQLRGKHILNSFVSPLAPQQVNLDVGLVDEMVSLDRFQSDSFDLVQDYVVALMSADLYPKFLQSAQYRDFCAGKLHIAPNEVTADRKAVIRHFQRQRGSTST